MKWNPYSVLLKFSRTLDKIGEGPRIKPNVTLLLMECSNKLTPNGVLPYT